MLPKKHRSCKNVLYIACHYWLISNFWLKNNSVSSYRGNRLIFNTAIDNVKIYVVNKNQYRQGIPNWGTYYCQKLWKNCSPKACFCKIIEWQYQEFTSRTENSDCKVHKATTTRFWIDKEWDTWQASDLKSTFCSSGKLAWIACQFTQSRDTKI